MEDQNSPIHTPLIDQTIEIRSSSANDISQGGSKICGGATCGFSDAGTASKDANERSASMKKLGIAVILCVVFMSIEVVGGIKANSLAILTDAAHLLSDVAAFAISMFSLWAAGWEATPRQSYGFYRIEILGTLVSIQLIWLLTGMLVYEAIVRLLNDSGEVQGFLMFLVSAFGLLVNIIMAIVLDHDHGHGHGHIHGHGEHHSHDHSHANHDHGHVHGVEHKHGHEITVTTHHHHSGHTKLEHEHEPLILKNSEDVEDHHAHGMEHRHGHDVTVTTTHHHHSGHTKLEHQHEPLIVKDSEDMEDPQANSKDHKRKQRNINVQGAYLHVLGDCIQSVGVMIGGGIIWYKPEWKIIDLICTLVFSVIVLVTTIKMLRNILEILMESTPREIDATRLEKGLCELDGVVAVHELHIWAITVGKVLLACHVTITPEADADLVLDKVVGYINREYNISHVTIQIERQ